MSASSPWHRAVAVACVCTALAGPGALAATGDPTIVGFVADHTFTSTGRRVYVAFERAWQAAEQYPLANLSVQERPDPRWGTLITIEHERRVVFQIPSAGVKSNPDRAAAPGVEAVLRYFAQNTTRLYSELDPVDELN